MGGYEAMPDFPTPICPITDVHARHRIPGTWRQQCPGVDERTAALLKVRADQAAGSVNPAADPGWVADRDLAGRMTDDEARSYYDKLAEQAHGSAQGIVWASAHVLASDCLHELEQEAQSRVAEQFYTPAAGDADTVYGDTRGFTVEP